MEKRLSVKFQKLIGTAIFPAGNFYEGQKFERPEPEIQSRRGTLFALLTLSGPKELEAAVFGQAIFDSLEEDYFSNLDSPPLAALEKSAFAAHRRLADMALAAHLSQGIDFNLLLAVSWGRVLYLCRLGAGAVYLLRDGKVSEVFLGEESNVATGSGFVYDGDGLILGSPDFRKNFPVTAVDSSLSRLEEKMFELSNRFRLAALVLKFQMSEVPNADEAINFIRPPVGLPAVAFLSNRLRQIKSLFGRKKADAGRSSPAKILPEASRPILEATPRLQPRLRTPKINFGRLQPTLLLLFLTAVFALSVFLTVRKSQALRLAKVTAQTLNQAELELTEAQDLVDLNNLEAAKILNKSLVALSQLQKLGVVDPRLAEYREKARALLAKVAKLDAVLEPKLLYDFELSQKGIGQRATNLAGNAGELFLGDKSSGTIWKLKINEPDQTEEVNQGKTTTIVKLATFGQRLVVLEPAGVSFIDFKKGTVVVGALVLDGQEVTDFANYNGNLYFLNTAKNQIQRASGTDGGFGKITNWFKEEAKIDQAQGLGVNGSVFIFQAGQVLKFEGGKRVDFSLTGLGESLPKDLFIYTGNGLSDLYLVGSSSLKIYKFSDLGQYVKTYDLSGTKIGTISSLYVNPASLKLYLLSGSKVYEISP